MSRSNEKDKDMMMLTYSMLIYPHTLSILNDDK